MRLFVKGDRHGRKETWYRTRGRSKATISCPNCGEVISLGSHKVDPELKVVTPDPFCLGCSWTDRAVLEGWE